MADAKKPEKKIPVVDCSHLNINLDEDPRNRDWLRDLRKKRLAAEAEAAKKGGKKA